MSTDVLLNQQQQLLPEQLEALDVNDNVDKVVSETPADIPPPVDSVAAGDTETTDGSESTSPIKEKESQSASEKSGTSPQTEANKLLAIGLTHEAVHSLNRFGINDLEEEHKESVRKFTSSGEKICLMESGRDRSISFVAKAAVLQQVEPETLEHQVLILTPTRHAGLLVTHFVRDLVQEHGVKIRACIGGYPLTTDVQRLRSGVQVVVGTVGRIIDLLERCVLNTSYFKTLVLENADEMLSGGPYEVWKIAKSLPDSVRIVLLSASMSEELVPKMTTLLKGTKEEMEKLRRPEMEREKYEERARRYQRVRERIFKDKPKRQPRERKTSGRSVKSGDESDRVEKVRSKKSEKKGKKKEQPVVDSTGDSGAEASGPSNPVVESPTPAAGKCESKSEAGPAPVTEPVAVAAPVTESQTAESA